MNFLNGVVWGRGAEERFREGKKRKRGGCESRNKGAVLDSKRGIVGCKGDCIFVSRRRLLDDCGGKSARSLGATFKWLIGR